MIRTTIAVMAGMDSVIVIVTVVAGGDRTRVMA